VSDNAGKWQGIAIITGETAGSGPEENRHWA